MINILIQLSDIWSSHLFKRVLDWNAHLERGHNPNVWANQLIHWHSEKWLEDQRLNGTQLRPGTRVCSGAPTTRWHDGVNFAKHHVQ